jgi:hypothetical protein
MRRLTIPLAMLLLSGCSGLGKFAQDTATLPGANPTKPSGVSENMLRVEARPVSDEPLESEAGNVWPGPPKAFPTLSEVERETQNGQIATPYSASGVGAGPGQGPSAFEPGNGRTSGSKYQMQSNPNAASTIVIPNGNGTSTQISPDGQVKIIPTPKTAPGDN